MLIPTIAKAKIPHLLSYPAGAETISKALAETAQFGLLRLQFYFWSDLHLRRGEYEFLRVEYLKDAAVPEKNRVRALYKRPPQYQWEIVVQAVPRVNRQRIRDFIWTSALPQIKTWLDERARASHVGSEILAFFFIESAEEFEMVSVTKIEPLR